MSRVVILVFADPLADKMLTGEEYAAISENMAHGISCFAPNFQGPREDALHFIVDHQLAQAGSKEG